ncbi:TfpX/TfpZ family type IV pilin accessory protein [Alkanindiges illinoisensis]|uniref:Type IV pilin accessory protein n=1 Tax=Alkanindiges illinoisensis TaxID=197183 RepID=A0A4Y7XCX8_9GAMM|nr:TfpX/TfpZ family type IV pilin accessory protein [Alkanindiges illinoisensis]TEU27956.1 type IV pilin accessory protein [Alkanindiges illinoisensis]
MPKRLKFFLSHLAISAIIAFIAIIMVFCVWYPVPLAKAIGVTHIFLMLLAIDVIIGPILGFIVYKEHKKSLKMDLGIIILIQALALSYGIYSIFEGRPAWLVYNVDRFELVRNNEVVKENIEKALPQYQQPSWLKPQYVAVEFAKDTQQRNNDMFAEVLGGVSLAQRPERYVSLLQAKTQMQQRALPLQALEQFNNKDQVQKLLSKYPAANGWVPLKASNLDMTVLVSKETGQVIKIVDLRPWS